MDRSLSLPLTLSSGSIQPPLVRRHPASLLPKSQHDSALLHLVSSPVTETMIGTFSILYPFRSLNSYLVLQQLI